MSTRTLPQSMPRRRGATLTLETQSLLVFTVAMLIGAAALAAPMPLAATGLLLVAGVLLVRRALAVLAADPSAARSVRPRELANWDGTLAASLGAAAVVFVLTGAPVAALVALGGAVALATLRLRTRYALVSPR